MKKSDDFLKELNRELDGLSLPMSEKLQAEPIAVTAESERPKRRPSRRLVAIGASALAACVALACILPRLTVATPAAVGGCMRLEINPSVTFVLDADGKVERLVSTNADGDTLLSDAAFVEGMLGRTASEAATKLAERAAQTGYIDLSADGYGGEYNDVGIVFEGVAAYDGTQVQAVEDALVAYFMEKGVYVYVKTENGLLEGGVSALNEWKARPTSFLEYVKTTGKDETEAAKATVYEYAKDLLVDSLQKYDLCVSIAEKNASIKEKTGLFGFGGSDYWTLTEAERTEGEVGALAYETAALLEKLYVRYGEDYRAVDPIGGVIASAAFEAYTAVYIEPLADEAEALRDFADGKRAPSELTFAEAVDIATLAAASGYGEELTESLRALLLAVVSEGLNEAQGLAESAAEFVVEWSEALYGKYAALFAAEREPIGKEDYEDFLKRIGKE